jgi:hypothetical protein
MASRVLNFLSGLGLKYGGIPLTGPNSLERSLLFHASTNIAYLGDFDFEEGINWKDLNIFVEAWNKNDVSKELGPVNGIP